MLALSFVHDFGLNLQSQLLGAGVFGIASQIYTRKLESGALPNRRRNQHGGATPKHQRGYRPCDWKKSTIRVSPKRPTRPDSKAPISFVGGPHDSDMLVDLRRSRTGSLELLAYFSNSWTLEKKHAKYLYNISHISDTYCWLLYV
jgi:hypothetical protein